MQDVQFAFVGDLSHAVCLRCGRIGKRLRPDLTYVAMAKIYNNVGGLSVQDPSFRKDFDEAAEVHDTKEAAGILPVCNPSGSVAAAKAYKLTVFQDFGLLGDKEYSELVERLPSHIKRQPVPFEWLGPGMNRNEHMISLVGLPVDVALGVKKVRVEFSSSAQKEENYLSENSQLHKSQAAELFRYVVEKHMDQRPEACRPGAQQRPPTLQELKHLHATHEQEQQSIAGRLANLEAPSPDRVKVAVQDAGFDGVLEQAPSRRQRRKATLPALSLSEAAQPLMAAGSKRKGLKSSAVDTSADAKSAASGKSAASETASLLATLDKDMQIVAEAHLSTPKGSSATSLENLITENFLADNIKGQNLKKQSAWLAGATCFFSCWEESITTCHYLPQHDLGPRPKVFDSLD